MYRLKIIGNPLRSNSNKYYHPEWLIQVLVRREGASWSLIASVW